MSNPVNPEDHAHKLAQAGIMLTQVLAEATIGYYNRLLEGNVPIEVASDMTREFHTALMTTMQAQTEAARKQARR